MSGFETKGTILTALGLDQESRDPISHLSRICSLFFPFLHFLSQKGGGGNHMLSVFETLYLITQLHGKRSLLHEHTDK